MKSKYYWLMGLGGVMSVVLVSGLANAHWNRTWPATTQTLKGTPVKQAKASLTCKYRHEASLVWYSAPDRQIS